MIGSSALLLLFPMLAALATAISPDGSNGRGSLWTAFTGSLSSLVLVAVLALQFDQGQGEQFTTRLPWVPEIGVVFHLGLDGLSLVMVGLAAILFCAGVLAVPGTMSRVSKPFLVWFLLLEAAVMGVFASRDWFLFYLFWEIALIPMFFLIGLWGGANRTRAAYSFFLYTLAGSVVMLVGLMAAYVEAVGKHATDSFEMSVIAQTMQGASAELQAFVFVCVFIGMAVKVPAVPMHGWLPAAHVEAPVPASIILSGVLLKMGGYGLVRLAEMVPGAFAEYGAIVLALGVLTIVYGAVLAFRQDDMKAMIAYSSVSHMGFVILGVGSLTDLGMRGAAFQMFSHGIVTAVLFLLVGVVYAQTHSRSLLLASGIGKTAPRFMTLMTIALLASMGLPGLSGFVGEFHVFMGSYERWGLIVALAGLGVLMTTAYSLRVFGRMAISPNKGEGNVLRDLGAIELTAIVPLTVIMIVLGLFPSMIAEFVSVALPTLTQP